MMLRLAFCHRETAASCSSFTSCSSYIKQISGGSCRFKRFASRSCASTRHKHMLPPAHINAGPSTQWQRVQSSATVTESTSSRDFQTEYEDPAFTWAKENPVLAQDCLEQPPLLVSKDDNLLVDDLLMNSFSSSKQQRPLPANSLEKYCQSRHWHFPISEDQQPLAMALVSHVLSAPLTLAQFHIDILAKRRIEELDSIKQVGEVPDKDRNDNSDANAFRWCLIGARAESTLPFDFWKEYLWLVEHYSNHLCPQGKPYNQTLNIQMDFVGPDIVIPPAYSKATVSWNKSALEVCWRHEGLFHDMIASQQPKQEQQNVNAEVEDSSSEGTSYNNNYDYDAYVLLNPGLGHDNLIKDWKPTIEYLLRLQKQEEEQQQSRSVICLSAHSKLDAQRDTQILNEMYNVDLNIARSDADNADDADCYPYKVNPFSSRITYRDPILASKSSSTKGSTLENGDHFVRPNHYVTTIW